MAKKEKKPKEVYLEDLEEWDGELLAGYVDEAIKKGEENMYELGRELFRLRNLYECSFEKGKK